MARKYDDSDTSAEATRARYDQMLALAQDGKDVPAELSSQIQRGADAAMDRAIRKHGRD
ncbi:hypothetical protein KDL01_04270 [Actinospica durhamensis]|uniref:Uncharacterized protein n=1 Tax=Actinospica durhamensis TaxID=1508375 RepID=A0A941ELC0_9ACTN|nr:hypothetical protein [Actinospica durhamensis]MBR7832458.1 hypothetical protein [Actinospica durhamensis]